MSEGSSQRIRADAEETGRKAGGDGAKSDDTAAPRVRELLRLQSAAGNAAVARAVKHRAKTAMRPPDGGGGGGSGAAPGGPAAAPPTGASETAIVASTTDTVKLRASGSDHARVVAELRLNQRLFLGGRHGNWRIAATASGAYGYLAQWLVDRGLVKTNLPDPLARLHEIESGETAIGIAERFYGDLVRPGQDLRFYVNVLEYVNRGPGERGIYQPNPSDTSTGAWKHVKARRGYLVWIPSDRFAQSLEGVVKSGSITGGLWARARGALEAVEDFAVGGAAFVAGLFEGALDSVKDLLTGLAGLIPQAWNLIRTFVENGVVDTARDLWSALKSIRPTDIAEAWIASFVKRWNASGIWSRWRFRGWAAGYAIVEIALLLLTGGGTAAAKGLAKMGKLGSFLLRRIGGLAGKARAVARKAPKRLAAAAGVFKRSRIAGKIADGHAYSKHVVRRGEFPEIRSKQEFQKLIERIMRKPSESASISRGRTKYWEDSTGTLVIHDPANADLGTCFRPTQGKWYYDHKVK